MVTTTLVIIKNVIDNIIQRYDHFIPTIPGGQDITTCNRVNCSKHNTLKKDMVHTVTLMLPSVTYLYRINNQVSDVIVTHDITTSSKLTTQPYVLKTNGGSINMGRSDERGNGSHPTMIPTYDTINHTLRESNDHDTHPTIFNNKYVPIDSAWHVCVLINQVKLIK